MTSASPPLILAACDGALRGRQTVVLGHILAELTATSLQAARS